MFVTVAGETVPAAPRPAAISLAPGRDGGPIFIAAFQWSAAAVGRSLRKRLFPGVHG